MNFTDHFEETVLVTNRLCNLLGKMNTEKLPVSDLVKSSIQIPGSNKCHSEKVNRVRNGVEHIAAKIQSGQIKMGQFVALGLNEVGDGAVLGAWEIKFDDIAEMIRGFHEVASLMASQPMS